MTKMAFFLPVPPSVNNLFVNSKRGRFPSPEYKAWRIEAGLKLNAQRDHAVKTVDYPVHLSIYVQDVASRSDLDNLFKAPIDLLVQYGVLAGDGRKIVRRLSAWCCEAPPEFFICVEPL